MCAYALHAGLIKSQAGRVEAVLKDISAKEERYCDSPHDGDTFFSAAENARIVKEAENYYRNSYMGGGNTWYTYCVQVIEVVYQLFNISCCRYHMQSLMRCTVSIAVVTCSITMKSCHAQALQYIRSYSIALLVVLDIVVHM
jgi:hypothetical protein